MDIRPIRESIVERLNEALTTTGTPFIAKELPDTSKGYDMGLASPIAYVIYSGSQADRPVSTNIIGQPRRLRFNVECHGRLLYAENGIDVLRDLVEQALVGFEPVNCHRLYLLKDDISQTDEFIWIHILQFECETMLVQRSEEDPIVVPSFKGINYKE